MGTYSRWALVRGWALVKFSSFSASSNNFSDPTVHVSSFDFLSQDEVKDWMFPSSFDPIKSEAKHLIHHADTDKVSYLYLLS